MDWNSKDQGHHVHHQQAENRHGVRVPFDRREWGWALTALTGFTTYPSGAQGRDRGAKRTRAPARCG